MAKNTKKSNLKKNVFYDSKSAILRLESIFDRGTINSVGVIAEQLYKDSDEFTYRESGDMYKSGELLSKFSKGLIIERTPYVRRRYYEGGKAGAGNKKAQPRWFEKTAKKYKDRYEDMAKKEFDKAKKG